MNKTNHILSAACLSLALSLSSCTTESAESPPPPSSDSQGGLSSSVIEAQSSSSDLAYSSSSAPAVSSSSSVSLSSSSSVPSSSSAVVPSSSSVLPSSGSGGGSSGTFTDTRDSQTYNWVKIGTQIWMAENLNYDASGSVCYENEDGNCDTYGRLYNWSTAMNDAASSSATPSGVQGVCPDGWHLPSDDEWTTLTDFIGGEITAGTKLKATSGWGSGYNGTDEFDFAALPGGLGLSGGSFYYDVGNNGGWWSTTEHDASFAWCRYMTYDTENVYRDINDKSYLFSVRCIQD